MRIPCDPDLVEEMKRMIDPTDFRTVKVYFRDPESEIQGVLLVQEGYRLEEVAAFFASPNEETMEAVYQQMWRERVILAGVDDFGPSVQRTKPPRSCWTASRTTGSAMSSICLPLYLVRVTDRKLD